MPSPGGATRRPPGARHQRQTPLDEARAEAASLRHPHRRSATLHHRRVRFGSSKSISNASGMSVVPSISRHWVYFRSTSQMCQIETFVHVKARGTSRAVRADCAILAMHQVSASSMSAFCSAGALGKTVSSLRRTSAVAAKWELRRSAALSASPLRTAFRMA